MEEEAEEHKLIVERSMLGLGASDWYTVGFDWRMRN